MVAYLGQVRIDLKSFLSVTFCRRMRTKNEDKEKGKRADLRDGIAVRLQFEVAKSSVGEVGSNRRIQVDRGRVLVNGLLKLFLWMDNNE